jgi:hypothetical protein
MLVQKTGKTIQCPPKAGVCGGVCHDGKSEKKTGRLVLGIYGKRRFGVLVFDVFNTPDVCQSLFSVARY